MFVLFDRIVVFGRLWFLIRDTILTVGFLYVSKYFSFFVGGWVLCHIFAIVVVFDLLTRRIIPILVCVYGISFYILINLKINHRNFF